MIEAESINAASTVRLLQRLEALYPAMTCIHVFPDNARHHDATEGASLAGVAGLCCIRPAFHFRGCGRHAQSTSPNRCYAAAEEFATLLFSPSSVTLPKNWTSFRDSVYR